MTLMRQTALDKVDMENRDKLLIKNAIRTVDTLKAHCQNMRQPQEEHQNKILQLIWPIWCM